ncbi:MAG: DUF420 domain-containing protein [Thermonemataceae bacterium]
MSNTTLPAKESYYKLINILSIAIPVAVAVLLSIRTKLYLGEWTSYLPHLNGIINSITSILLVLGLIAIRKKNVKLHRSLMLASFVLGAIFLIAYIFYHISNPSTSYGGEGLIRYVYFFFLITHILLSIIVVRFVLLALYYAVSKQFTQHKRIVKIAYPVWLYVSITGVIVYLMISPYYT